MEKLLRWAEESRDRHFTLHKRGTCYETRWRVVLWEKPEAETIRGRPIGEAFGKTIEEAFSKALENLASGTAFKNHDLTPNAGSYLPWPIVERSVRALELE